ncbi:integrase, catalytic region, zinc finger, CCHC-type containing protein [Tanacetum coccineum]
MNHQTSTVPQVIPQVAYQSPQDPIQLMTKSPFVDLGFAVLVFSLGDDPIACLNKEMAFLTAIASSSSRGNTTSGQARVVKCYNCQGEGHMARQCTQPKRTRNVAWYKEKAMLVEAQEAGQILVEEQLAFLADPGISASQAQTVIPHNAAFQTEDLDTYDSDCDDLSTAQAVLMDNISNYGSDVISKVPNSETYLNDMDNQSVHALQDFEQSPVIDFTINEISKISEQMINHVNNWEKANKEQNNESITAELERYKERVKTFEQRLNIDLSSREKMIDSQMDDMIREKLALKEQIDSLEQNLSKQIKEKESLFKTFTVFKNESKEKENKYMENEIDLEKKIKELDNIVYKVGQSAQTVHMLTKPQAFYDNTHKQALGYQNPFYLRKAQRIKPTLYDGAVISKTHVAMPVIDDEETLILEEESRSKMFEKAKDPEVIAKKISHKPIDYEKLNSLIEDFETRFSPQQELSVEQAFFLKTKDEAPTAIIKCIKNIQVRLKATVRNVRTDNGTKLVNQTLREWYENVGITHQTFVARTPSQNGVVKRRNRTLVEAARTILIFSKASLFLWAEAINTACYTQNRSLKRLRYNKTPYELMQDKKPDSSFFHVFGSLCYPTNDNEDLGKFDVKVDIRIFVGYAPAKKAFRIYNRMTRIITETIHVTFEELTAMASEQFSSGPGLQGMTPATSST